MFVQFFILLSVQIILFHSVQRLFVEVAKANGWNGPERLGTDLFNRLNTCMRGRVDVLNLAKLWILMKFLGHLFKFSQLARLFLQLRFLRFWFDLLFRVLEFSNVDVKQPNLAVGDEAPKFFLRIYRKAHIVLVFVELHQIVIVFILVM